MVDSDAVSEEKNFNMWPRDCSCDILVKNVAALCSCLKSLPETKVKRFKLLTLTKEISKQPSLDSISGSPLRNILIKHSKLRKEKHKIHGLMIKQTPGSEIEVNHVFKDIKWN